MQHIIIYKAFEYSNFLIWILLWSHKMDTYYNLYLKDGEIEVWNT